MEIFGVHVGLEALSNFDILDLVKKLKIRHFRGCFMKNELSGSPKNTECGIVNFQSNEMRGSHWVAYYKTADSKDYFDSFGGPVLQEIRNYLGGPLYRSTIQVQKYDTTICGQLCLFWLKSIDLGRTFDETLKIMGRVGGGIQWSNELADELHKPLRVNYVKRHVFVRRANEIYGADLIDYSSLSKQNSGFKWVLMIIDCFSKFGWGIPLRNKTGLEVLRGLKIVYDKSPSKRLWVDEGKEFYNKDVENYLKSKGVILYSTHNTEKCSIVERWNRTVKTKLEKYFTANYTKRYIDILQDLIDLYNRTRHRSIKMSPDEASLPKNHDRVFRNLYQKRMREFGEQKPKFTLGQKVRIALQLGAFDKRYGINWTDDVYTIKEILKTRPLTYCVMDENGHVLKGRYYNEDLQAVHTDIFRINKVLKRKTLKGKKLAYVSWMGNSKNSWIPAEDVQG